MIEKKEDVSRQEKVYIYIFKTFQDLKEKGVLVGGNLQVNPDKLYLIDGFVPTEEEISNAMDALAFQGYIKRESLKYPAYCCQKCGEVIGYLGRFLLFGVFHKCK